MAIWCREYMWVVWRSLGGNEYVRVICCPAGRARVTHSLEQMSGGSGGCGWPPEPFSYSSSLLPLWRWKVPSLTDAVLSESALQCHSCHDSLLPSGFHWATFLGFFLSLWCINICRPCMKPCEQCLYSSGLVMPPSPSWGNFWGCPFRRFLIPSSQHKSFQSSH